MPSNDSLRSTNSSHIDGFRSGYLSTNYPYLYKNLENCYTSIPELKCSDI